MLLGCHAPQLPVKFFPPDWTVPQLPRLFGEQNMYEHLFHFFGLRENPFHVSPDPRFYFPTRAHDTALAELQFGVDSRQGFIILTGESGTGKTTVLNHFLNWLQDRRQSSSYIFHSLLKPSELFEYVLRDFGVACDGRDRGEVLETLHRWLIQRHALGDSPVLIIDEAQAISVRTLDQVRLLLNLETPGSKLLQIVLAGQPELEEKLRRPELRQLRQRVMFRCQLVPLSLEESALYIKSRLAAGGASDLEVFTPASVEAAHTYAHGIPRTLNLLCEHALIAGYADQTRTISPEIIHRVATEFDLGSQAPARPREWERDSRFGRLVAFRPEDRSARVTAQMEYLESLDELVPGPITQPITSDGQAEPDGVRREVASAAAGEQVVPSGSTLPNAAMGPVADTFPGESLPQIPVANTVPLAPTDTSTLAMPANWTPPASPMPGATAAAAAPARIPGSSSHLRTPAPTPAVPASETGRPSTVQGTASQTSVAAPASAVVTLPAKPVAPTGTARIARQEPSLGVRFVRYWKAVKDSFLYDWRQFMGAHGLARNFDTSVATLQRNVIVPISKWLREPVKPSQNPGKTRQHSAGGKRQRG